MRKRPTCISLLVTLFSICIFYVLTGPAQARVALTEGEFVVLGDDLSLGDVYNQMLFQDMVFEIDDLGKAKGTANVSFTDLDLKGALRTGTLTLNLEGNYDTKENSLSGTFLVKFTSSMVDEPPPPLLSYYGNNEYTFDGTISGGWSSKESAFEIFFNGTAHSVGKTWNGNGKEEEQDTTTEWHNKAVFREDFCASLLARAESKPKWKLIQTAQAKDSGARFAAFSGEVLIAPQDDLDDERAAEDDMVLEEGDIVTTGGDSCAMISYADGSTFIMKARSKVILAAAPERQSQLELVAGNILVNLKHIYETGQLEVTMNDAIAGTKGTTFVASEDGTNSTLKVIEGLMYFRSLATGQEIDVGSGEMVSADSDGMTEKTAFDTETESSSWEKIQGNLTLFNTKSVASDESPVEPSSQDDTSEPQEEISSEAEEPKSKGTLFAILSSLVVLVVLGFLGIKFARRK
ncbi:MAG: FecR family protein [bacterium]|nr:FecR family protein [bacterium]